MCARIIARDVEVIEAIKQTGPQDGDKAGRNNELREAGERRMADFAARDGAFDHGAHRADATRNDLAIIELGELRKPCAFGDNQARHVATTRAIDFAHEQISEALKHGADREIACLQLLEPADQRPQHAPHQFLK